MELELENEPPAYVSDLDSRSGSSTRLPSYSPEAQSGEQSLASSARFRLPFRPSGTFTKSNKSGTITLTLLHQEDGIQIPTYGKNGLVEGRISLASVQDVQTVELLVTSLITI